jgi:hypothetical protein
MVIAGRVLGFIWGVIAAVIHNIILGAIRSIEMDLEVKGEDNLFCALSGSWKMPEMPEVYNSIVGKTDTKKKSVFLKPACPADGSHYPCRVHHPEMPIVLWHLMQAAYQKETPHGTAACPSTG